MPSVDLLSRQGLLLVDDFLEVDFCAAICTELATAPSEPASLDQVGVSVVDRSIRRAAEAAVSATTFADVYGRLEALMHRLEEHFRVSLSECEPPAFITYVPGDFIRPHTDVSSDEDSSDALKERKVVVTVSLNDAEDDRRGSGEFSGGVLTLYGVVREAPWDRMGFPVGAKVGRLIAFPAGLVHEVTEVTAGERFVVVSRFR